MPIDEHFKRRVLERMRRPGLDEYEPTVGRAETVVTEVIEEELMSNDSTDIVPRREGQIEHHKPTDPEYRVVEAAATRLYEQLEAAGIDQQPGCIGVWCPKGEPAAIKVLLLSPQHAPRVPTSFEGIDVHTMVMGHPPAN